MIEPARALLAAVPLQHLESGEGVFGRYGSVIFGSDRYGLFEERGVDEGAVVYIYASHTQPVGAPRVTWQATYVRYIRHEEMRREEQKRRPPSTEGEEEAPWVGFWEVRDFRRLSTDESFPISDLAGEDGKPFNPTFVPHGPVAIRG